MHKRNGPSAATEINAPEALEARVYDRFCMSVEVAFRSLLRTKIAGLRTSGYSVLSLHSIWQTLSSDNWRDLDK